jgi:glutamine amidotransferase
MVTVVDAGTGNLRSLGNALRAAGLDYAVRSRPPAGPAQVLLLPGVGAFGHAANELERQGWAAYLRDSVREGARLIGICLGMQLLFEESEESPGVRGLGLLPGTVVKLDASRAKVPHIAWERLRFTDGEPPGPRPAWAYFVHSYAARPGRAEEVTAWARHGEADFPAVVRSGNVTGVQFHPEKSQDPGVAFLGALARGGLR